MEVGNIKEMGRLMRKSGTSQRGVGRRERRRKEHHGKSRLECKSGGWEGVVMV